GGFGSGIGVTSMGLLPEPAGVPVLDCTGGEQVSGADFGCPQAGEPLPRPGQNCADPQRPPAGVREGGESGDQGKSPDPTGVPSGQRLGDRATHRVPDHIDHPQSQVVEDAGDIVGDVLDVVAARSERGESVTAMVDDYDPTFGGQFRGDLIPLTE